MSGLGLVEEVEVLELPDAPEDPEEEPDLDGFDFDGAGVGLLGPGLFGGGFFFVVRLISDCRSQYRKSMFWASVRRSRRLSGLPTFDI